MKINKELKFNSGEGKAAISIVNMIQDLDGQAFIVGGAVRDALLGIEPKDVDIATDQRLESLASIFGKDNVNFVGESFGVAIVSHMGEKVEVATFRKDGEYTDGRRPDTVEFSTSAEDDSNRRDLTINALFFDPVENVLHDFHGGLEDLEDSIIRTVGDPVQRFSEDNLRMLRVVRFASRLGFTVAAATQDAIRSRAGHIVEVSGERVFMELDKMLVKSPAVAMVLMRTLGLLKFVLPEVDALVGVEQSPDYHPEGDAWNHVMLILSHMEEGVSSDLAWAALLHDIGKPSTTGINDKGNICSHGHAKLGADMARVVLGRLKGPKKFTDAVCSVINNHMKMISIASSKRSTIRRTLARPTIELDLELCRLDALGKGTACNLANHEKLMKLQAEFANEPVIPPPLVDGRDAMDVGFPQGPGLGVILREVQELQLMGELVSKEGAMEFLRARVAQ